MGISDRGKNTKAVFYKIFFKQLAEYNFHEMKVNQVIQLSGKSKGSFYHHFTNMEDLAASACRNQTNRVVAAISNQSNAGRISDDIALILGLNDELSDAAARRLFELRLKVDNYPKLEQAFRDDYDTRLRLLTCMIDKAIAQGKFRKDVDPVSMASWIYNCITGVFYSYFTVDNQTNKNEQIERQLRMLTKLISV